MTKFKKVLLGCVGLYILAALSLAHAQGAPGEEGPSQRMHPGKRIQEVFNQLNLTDDQKKLLESNKQDHRSRMESARQSLKADKEALQKEIMAVELDMPKIRMIHQQIKNLQVQMEDEKLSSILEVRSILTPEQFSEFVGLMHKHRSEHEGHLSENLGN